ncbi:MAG TPA: hypothetical protein VEY30_05000 [Myxococcaceae bacterium]|nr:hypothetical protein [Myxococcaceae bacterium]
MNAAALIPDDQQVITWTKFSQDVEKTVNRLKQLGVPVVLEKIERDSDAPPILHVTMGQGALHVINVDGVHPNESHSLVTSLAEMRAWGEEPLKLVDHNLTIHWICLAPEQLQMNEDGLVGTPNMFNYFDNLCRSGEPSAHPAWGIQYEGDCRDPEASRDWDSIFRLIVDSIYEKDGQVIAGRVGHNAPLKDAHYVGGAGPAFSVWRRDLNAVIEAHGPAALVERPASYDLGMSSPTDGLRYVFPFAKGSTLRAEYGPTVGDSPEDYIRKKATEFGHLEPLFVHGEVMSWRVRTAPPALKNALLEEVLRWNDKQMGRFEKLMTEAGKI